MNQQLTTTNGKLDAPLSVSDLLGQVNLIQEVMRAVMKDGEHFGKIPGCGDKPALLQPGAQKLLVTFRLAPEYTITEKMLERGHREYQILCTLKTIGSGSFVGQGAGSASTMEGKWRYRVAPKTLTNRPVPAGYWDLRKADPQAAQTLLGGKGFSTKKDDSGQWMIAEGSSEKVEHDNPADYYNTVLKMGCKRALVAATLTATAASDIFTQDVEEIVENMRAAEVHAEPAPDRGSPVSAPRRAAPEPSPEPEDNVRFEDAAPALPPSTEKALNNLKAAADAAAGELPQVEGTVIAFSKKETKRKGSFRYGFKIGEAWFATFDANIAEVAENAKLEGFSVRCIYEVGSYGNDCKFLNEIP